MFPKSKALYYGLDNLDIDHYISLVTTMGTGEVWHGGEQARDCEGKSRAQQEA